MQFAVHPPSPPPRHGRAGVDRGRRTIVRALGAGMTAAAGGVAWAEEARPIYSLGVFPFLPALKIGERFAPAALDLGDALQAQIQLRTKDTAGAYADQVLAGAYDIVLVHPFLYVEGRERQGYRALAQADRRIRAVLVGRRDLAGSSLADLRGRTIAIVPLTATALLLQAALVDEGLANGDGLLLEPHQTKVSCLRAVTSGEAAGCVIPSTVDHESPAVRGLDLAPIWQSQPIASLVLAVHPRVPATVAERLRQRVLGWSGTAQGQAILQGLSWPRLLGAEDSDFDGVRAIRVRLLAGVPG